MTDQDQSLATIQANQAAGDWKYSGFGVVDNIRQALESMIPVHAHYNITTPAATTISTGGTYVKAAGTTTEFGSPRDFSMPANNRLLYTPTGSLPAVQPRRMKVMITGQGTVDTAGDTLGIQLAKNGTEVTNAQVTQIVTTVATGVTFSLVATVDMVSGDYIEVWTTKVEASGTATINNLAVSVIGFLNA